MVKKSTTPTKKVTPVKKSSPKKTYVKKPYLGKKPPLPPRNPRGIQQDNPYFKDIEGQYRPKEGFQGQPQQVQQAVNRYAFIKIIPYIFGSILIALLKYKDAGAVIATAIGDAYIKDVSGVTDKNFAKSTKMFINKIVEILSSFDRLELLAFSSALFAFFSDEIPRIIKNSQNIQNITYADIYSSIFGKLLILRDTFGNKLGVKYEKTYPLK